VAQLKTMTETNNSGEAQGYLYVLSNQHLGEDLDKAREFNATVFGALAESLHVFVEPNEWKEEKYPASPDTFATVRRYKAALLKPGELIGGVETEFWIYQYEDGDVQVTVLYVLPKDVDRGEKMFERVPLSLETVNINGNRLGHQSGQNQRVGGSGDSGKKGL
jgi:hypothetical protein